MKNSGRTPRPEALARWRNGTEFADRLSHETFGLSGLSALPIAAFALELFYGVLRNLTLLDFWIGQLRSEPVDAGRARHPAARSLSDSSSSRLAAHAAVFETVELARPRVRPLINAILRRALREEDRPNERSRSPAARRFDFPNPEFLIEKWSRQFGARATLELCQWNNRPAPIYARINQLRTTVAEFLHRYPGSFALPGSANFVGLPDPTAAAQNGDCYIQDPSTAIACEMLRPSPGETRARCLRRAGRKVGLSRGNDGKTRVSLSRQTRTTCVWSVCATISSGWV